MFGLPFPLGCGRRSIKRVITLTLYSSKKETNIRNDAIISVSDCGDHRILEGSGSCIGVIESQNQILKLLGWDKIIKEDIRYEKEEKQREKERIKRDKEWEEARIKREKEYEKRDRKLKREDEENNKRNCEIRRKKYKKKNKIRSG